MADLRRSVRDLFLQGVEAVNNAANHVANATRSKVDELNLRNRRKELLDQLAAALYEQWKDGLDLPEALTSMLEELRDIDEQLEEPESQPEPTEPAAEEEEEAVPTIEVDAEAEETTPTAAPQWPDEKDVPHIEVAEPEEPKAEE